jgi:hypothetical protein
MEELGKYYGDLRVAADRGKLVSSVLVIGWLLFPVAVQTAFHPADAVGFEYWLQHQPVPRFYTEHMVAAGEITAAMALIGLGLFMLGATVLFYRRAGYWVKLWPAAAIVVGLIANGVWWYHTGYFDRVGALAGATSLALMVICEAVCEHLGADFVFGQGKRPRRA